MLRTRALLVAVAVVVGTTGLLSVEPAHAVSPSVCVVDGFIDFPGGLAPAPLLGPPGGGFAMSSLALVCGGTLLGTGVFSGGGTFDADLGVTFHDAGFTMTVGSTTCSGAMNGISNRVEYAFFVSTGCGQFIIFGVGVPAGANGMPAITRVHLTAVGVIAPALECSWVSGSGCTYVADSSSASAYVVSPLQPAVGPSGSASASWSSTPIPGSGTYLWTGTISTSVGTTVSVSTPPNTSGVIVAD